MTNPSAPLPTRRADLMARLADPQPYDLAIVGGGATGLGVALDAAARGYRVVLVESHDFAKGTSSRATKLVHGGVRYLAQGNISLVREALHERATLLHNAPHLAQPLPFVLPAYRWWEKPFYGMGLHLYDALAGRAGLGATQIWSADQALSAIPGLSPQGLRGGVHYWDGQFDDARLALALARTAALHGALVLNYCRASQLHFDAGRVAGLVCEDALTGQSHTIQAHCVVNASGVWADALREQDGLANAGDGRGPTRPMVAPSQGVHLVVDRDFLGGDTALIVPKTADGRVLFAVPWLGKVILGTTDTPRHDLAREPTAFKEEVDFILTEAARYLRRAPTRADVRSHWVGLRPLVKPLAEDGERTKALSREHTILVSRSGLVTVTGGKWTTYRAMAQDVLHRCIVKALLPARPEGITQHLRLIGAPITTHASATPNLASAAGLHTYGSEQDVVLGLPGADQWITPGLSQAMVRFAARYEYAITVEDVLARRARTLFLDARLAAELAPTVAAILEEETGLPPQTEAFASLAAQYLQLPA